MRPVTISLSPNTTKNDMRTVWKVLTSPLSWRKESILQQAAQEVTKLFPGKFAVLTSSGRQALYDILRAVNIGKGDEVIIQAFTCIAVPAPIMWVGATPIYADIKKGTYNVDVDDVRQKITSKTKAIIAQHTFGIPAAIEEVRAIAREHNIVLIEDCAHALGSIQGNQQVGTFGDVSILSFGRDKVISSVFGGAVITSNPSIMQKVLAFQKQRPFPPFYWVKQQLLHPLLFRLIIPSYFILSIGKLILVASQLFHLVSKAVADEERYGRRPVHIQYRFSPALAQLLITQIYELKGFRERRKEIVDSYTNVLREIQSSSNKSFVLPTIEAGADPVWLRFPLLVKDAKHMRNVARQTYDILLGDWYDAPLVPSNSAFDVFHYIEGSCPVAEKTAAHVVNLPTYPTMTNQQVERVITFLRDYFTHNQTVWKFENL